MAFEIYKDGNDEYRWRYRSKNHKTMADSSEGYASKQGAKKALAKLRWKFVLAIFNRNVKDLTKI